MNVCGREEEKLKCNESQEGLWIAQREVKVLGMATKTPIQQLKSGSI